MDLPAVESSYPGKDPAYFFLPDFCSVRVVFFVVIAAELLSIVLVLGSSRPMASFSQDLSILSLYVQWVALGACSVLCAGRRWLRRLGNRLAGAVAYLVLLGVTLLMAELAFRVLSHLGMSLNLGGEGRTAFFLKSLGVSSIVSALALRYFYLQHLWRRQVVAEAQARFQALQARIRPHFLFNSMNTIAELTRTRPALAEDLINDLADLFRVSMADVSRISTLSDELDLVKRYLHIEGQRLEDRLSVQWDLRDLPGQAVMPLMILQPLVENAVYHGIETASEPGTIQISGRYTRLRVNIGIRNKRPPGTAIAHREGNRLALDNTRQRLESFFAGQASLTVTEVEGDYQVRLAFPHPWRRP